MTLIPTRLDAIDGLTLAVGSHDGSGHGGAPHALQAPRQHVACLDRSALGVIGPGLAGDESDGLHHARLAGSDRGVGVAGCDHGSIAEAVRRGDTR